MAIGPTAKSDNKTTAKASRSADTPARDDDTPESPSGILPGLSKRSRAPISSQDILVLQRLIGNQAVQRLLARSEQTRSSPRSRGEPLRSMDSVPAPGASLESFVQAAPASISSHAGRAPLRIQRMRLTFTPSQEIEGTNHEKHTAAEIQVDDDKADLKTESVAIRIFPDIGPPGSPPAAPKTVDVPRAVCEDLRRKGTREPDVAKDHENGSIYRPINQPAFLNGGPAPGDVRQGLMGDCRIISALEALALKQPELILSAIQPGGRSGSYTIRLRPTKGPLDQAPNTQAAPVGITVTNALPVERLNPTQLLYALREMKGSPGEGNFALWPALLEKAFAQLWGGYEKLTGALEIPVFFALGAKVTKGFGGAEGMLFTTFMTSEVKPEQWKKGILAAWQQGNAMTTTARALQHNYSIVGVSDTGITVSDPNTRRDEGYRARVNQPTSYAQVQGQSPFGKSDLWPMFFTWGEFFDAFKWVYGVKAQQLK